MSDGINIISPDNMDPEEMKKVMAGQKNDAALEAAQKRAEAQEIAEEIEEITNAEVAPYHDGAPLCSNQTATTGLLRQTVHHGVVQMPAFTHGRCIGAACDQWKNTNRGGICGRVLTQLADGQKLGVIGDAEIDQEFKRWTDPVTPQKSKVVAPK